MEWAMLAFGIVFWLIAGLSEPSNPGAWGAGLLFVVPGLLLVLTRKAHRL